MSTMPVQAPVVQTCRVGTPACDLPADYSIQVAGLAPRFDRPVLPTLTGLLWVCEFHSGIPMEEW